ncbi:hypothetical protein [Paenibacillus sp. PL2-23]|uniref:hypothetical protein n=1 Tax=Paenibacillus sp. PL2-23 TaxID=2100729 RepID=UPI00349E79F3
MLPEISPFWVESACDIGSFVLSVSEFDQNPSNVTAPSNFKGIGWEKHHIFEKRFASQLGTTSADMLLPLSFPIGKRAAFSCQGWRQ